jgi:DNA-binding Lrp family transcriptional regulator
MGLTAVLDRIDYEIIAELQKNARLSNKDLARRVDLAPSSCHARVRALQAAGVFRGFHAEVEPEVLGIQQQALIFVGLSRHNREVVEQFVGEVTELPEVVRLFNISGQMDFVLQVVARDTLHLRNFALDHLASRPEVTRIETSLVFDQVGKAALPRLAKDAA